MTLSRGPFTLSSPLPDVDESVLPLRGDVAHIELAGRYFVPHYAIPQPRIISSGSANLLKTGQDDADSLLTLSQGDSFLVLDIAGKYAWGCLSVEGPTGYVALDQLEAVS